MKILIAGATGAIGQPLVKELLKEGYEVYGITLSKERSAKLAKEGAKPVILDVLNTEAVAAVLSDVKPTIVIDMLTRLPKEYTPESMRQAALLDAQIRMEGGANLLTAAVQQGVKRYIAQSSGFWYEPGEGMADENTSMAFQASPGIAASVRLYEEIEKRLFKTSSLEGVALRFGFFYGLGTWFNPEGDVAEQIRKQQFPIIEAGEGVWNFVHIEDAAHAIVSAIKSVPGVYNVVNDHPSPMHEWLPAFAKYLKAAAPPFISEKEGFKLRGADSVYYATKLRAASNAKAKKELHFKPRLFEWIKQDG